MRMPVRALHKDAEAKLGGIVVEIIRTKEFSANEGIQSYVT